MTESQRVPRYTGRRIISCPEHGTDLIDEGLDLWCPAGQHAVSFTAAVIEHIDGDPDD